MASIGQKTVEDQIMTERIKNNGDSFIYFAAEQLGMEDYTEKLIRWTTAHPFLATLLVISAGFSVIPVVSFLTFVVLTLVFGFLTLLVIEGTIITIAGLIFLLVLGGCLTIAFSTTIFISVSYRAFSSFLGFLRYAQPSFLRFRPSRRQPNEAANNFVSNRDGNPLKEKLDADYIKEE